MKEDARGRERDSSQEAASAFVIAGGKGAIVFQLSEEVFNQMARLIEVRIIGAGLAPVRLGGNNNRHRRLLQHGKDALLGIIREKYSAAGEENPKGAH